LSDVAVICADVEHGAVGIKKYGFGLSHQ
jgi:hypothetical protein